jgi:hypothetical protein
MREETLLQRRDKHVDVIGHHHIGHHQPRVQSVIGRITLQNAAQDKLRNLAAFEGKEDPRPDGPISGLGGRKPGPNSWCHV